MNLEHGEEAFGRDAQRGGHPAAIFHHMHRIILRADTAIQAGVNSCGNAAFAVEESMMQAGNGRQQRSFQHHDVSALLSGVSSAKPASVVRLGSEMPSTLNNCPMPLLPPPTSRFNALATSSETSWLALAIRLIARV